MPLQIESAAEKKHKSLSVCDREKERKESTLMVMRCVLRFHPVLYAPQGCRNDCIALLKWISPPALFPHLPSQQPRTPSLRAFPQPTAAEPLRGSRTTKTHNPVHADAISN